MPGLRFCRGAEQFRVQLHFFPGLHPHMVIAGHMPKASSRECLQPSSPVGVLGLPQLGKPSVETQEDKQGQQRVRGRGA